ncbi:kinase [Sphingomonas sp. SRS2]|uniref:kinase n=1 Tax=Sphingomonas sp. SRS2 TaxID=133190 RepID=UPI003FA7C8DC
MAGPAIDMIGPHVHAQLAARAGRPVVIGICGAQGSGKSTIAAGLAERLRVAGLRAATLSIDDIYLDRQERERLAATHPLLRTRGVPGTHDVDLGRRTIEACGRDGTCILPRFSKSADSRAPESAWERVEGPVEVLLFEGWCVGALPQAAAALAEPVNALERLDDPDGRWRRYVNDCLDGSYRPLFDRIDWLVLLAAPNFDCVAGWRRQQEHRLRASLPAAGKGLDATMDDAGIDRFVQHYQRITQHILAEMPGRANLTIRLDEARRPVAQQEPLS